MHEYVEQFDKFLRKKSLKLTSGRQCILQQVVHIDGHFDTESLYALLKKKNVRVSRDAVFRNVPLLLEAGVIQKSVGEGKGEYYEVVVPHEGHHDHMVCTECGSVIEFFSNKLEKLQAEICKEYKFKMTFHDHRIFGLCSKCQEK